MLMRIDVARNRFSSRLRRFAAEPSGSIAAVVGIGFAVLTACVGAAVDFKQALRIQTILQSASDAAVIGATKARGLSDTERAERAVDLFNANLPGDPNVRSATPVADFTSGTASLTVTVAYNTAFLKLAGIQTLPVKAESRAVLLGKKIELTLVTDITGSMSDTRNGMRKIDGLKLAAHDMLDFIMPGNTQSEDFRVALVPFANYVNAGAYAEAVTGLNPTRNNGGSTEYLVTCVTERTGPQAYTDATPGPSAYIGASAQGNSNSAYDSNGGCDRSGGGGSGAMPAIVPLTTDKTSILTQIDSFTPAGSTAGHLGTAWGWYMISPQWNSIWNLSTPIAAYNDETVMKVVVILTDGEYNTQYSNTLSKDQALSMCSAMKTAGVTVFTVGFGFDPNNTSDSVAMDTLTQCASGAGHYYFPYDGDALRQTFLQIGDTVSSAGLKVRLSQ